MIIAALAMLVANAAAILGALSITRRISTGSLSVDAVLFLLVRYVLIAAAVLGTGLARGLTPPVLGVLGLAGLALWAATGEHRRLRPLPELDLGWPLWGVISLILVRLLWQVWVLAPYSVDPLSYHLPKVAHWIQQGALLPYPGADVRETFPAGFELLETWWCVFIHHDVLIEMAGVEFLALGAAATAALARYAGLGVRASAVAAILFSLTPAPLLQATSCMNDGPVASVMLAALALTAFRCHPLLILSSLAVGVGLKPTFASVVPAVALLWFLGRRTPPRPLPRRTWALAVAGLALAVGTFWYGLNAARFGNPLYPVGSLATVEKGSLSAIKGASLGLRLNQLVGSAIYDEADHYTVQFILVAGWGALLFACGGVALVAMLRSNPALRKLAAAFGVALLMALQFAPQGSFYLRFILFFPALGALAAAALGEALPRTTPVLWFCALLCFLSTGQPGDLNRAEYRRLSETPWYERVLEPLFMKKLPLDGTVACLAGTYDDSNGEAYLAYGPAFSRKVVYLDHIASVEDLQKQARDRNARWLFAQARNGDGSSKIRVLAAEKEGVVWEVGWERALYRVRWR